MPELTTDFIDEMLAEAENAEAAQKEAYYDLVLADVARLKNRIQEIFEQADAEKVIIEEFALRQSTKLQDRVDFLVKQLEGFLATKDQKTLEMPHGTLRFRKGQARVEVSDLALFLENATSQMLTVTPESAKPSISGIKSYLKMTSGKIPPGVKITEGKQEFSFKLREEKKNNGEK